MYRYMPFGIRLKGCEEGLFLAEVDDGTHVIGQCLNERTKQWNRLRMYVVFSSVARVTVSETKSCIHMYV